jgi:IS30 family transposase
MKTQSKPIEYTTLTKLLTKDEIDAIHAAAISSPAIRQIDAKIASLAERLQKARMERSLKINSITSRKLTDEFLKRQRNFRKACGKIKGSDTGIEFSLSANGVQLLNQTGRI